MTDHLPMCAVCGRPVDSLTQLPTVSSTVMRFEVQCHGATETTVVQASDLIGHRGRLVPGVAFSAKQIAP